MNGKRKQADLLIAGAGPAGLSAGAIAAEAGLRVIVLDEYLQPGGRLAGQFHEEKDRWWIGRQIADEWLDKNRKLGVEIRCGVSVYGIRRMEGQWELATTEGTFAAPYALLATGAAEVPLPVAGWTLPGVMSIGAAQVLTNVHYVKPGRRGLIIGANVLAMAIARELSVSGVEIAGIVLPPQGAATGKASDPKTNLRLLMGLSQLAPSPWLRAGGQLAKAMGMSGPVARFFPRGGIRIWNIPLQLRTAATAINGTEQVESVTLADVDSRGGVIAGSEREEPVDFVAIAGGLYPLAELAAVAGCPFVGISELGGDIPLHSERMQTPLEGLYVAGNITGVESALVAMAQGRLAATAIASAMGAYGAQGEAKVEAGMREVHRVRATALIQFRPGIAGARRKLYRLNG